MELKNVKVLEIVRKGMQEPRYQKMVGFGVLVIGCSLVATSMFKSRSKSRPKQNQKIELSHQNIPIQQSNDQLQNQQKIQSQQQSQVQEDDNQIVDSKSSKQKKKEGVAKKQKPKTNKISIMKKSHYDDDNTPVKKQLPQKKLKFMTDVETEYSESERLRFKKDQISRMIADHTKNERKEDQLFFQCLMMNLNETDNESEH